METIELFNPQFQIQLGRYTFSQGVAFKTYSSKTSYYDWASIRFSEELLQQLQLAARDPAKILLGYNGGLEEVFSGYITKPPGTGSQTNDCLLKDAMLLLEETTINATFLEAKPQDLITYFLAQAGISDMQLSAQVYPERDKLPLQRMDAIKAMNAVNAAWGIKQPFFFQEGIFYWGAQPAQAKMYTFEYGMNIISLGRSGSRWELVTVGMPIRHSQRIGVRHPKISGEFEVNQVVTSTNEAGFPRTAIYF